MRELRRLKAIATRFFVSIAAIALLALVLPITAAHSHGGGLDSLGCHHDRKKGGYHCHRGPLAGKTFNSKAEADTALKSLPQKK